MLTASAVQECHYTEAVNRMLARVSGWSELEIASLQAGRLRHDDRLAPLLAVARAAAGNSGRVLDPLWSRALDAGWSTAQLLETYALVGLVLFTGGFAQFAGTALDVPTTLAPAEQA
jgi:hypothetical protein